MPIKRVASRLLKRFEDFLGTNEGYLFGLISCLVVVLVVLFIFSYVQDSRPYCNKNGVCITMTPPTDNLYCKNQDNCITLEFK